MRLWPHGSAVSSFVLQVQVAYLDQFSSTRAGGQQNFFSQFGKVIAPLVRLQRFYCVRFETVDPVGPYGSQQKFRREKAYILTALRQPRQLDAVVTESKIKLFEKAAS